MSTRVTIELKNEAELLDRLRKITEGVADVRPLLTAIGEVMRTNVNYRFDTKTDPSGKPWAKLSPLTAQFYAMTGDGKNTPKRTPSRDDWTALRAGKIPAAKMPGSLLERTRHMRESLAVNTGADYVEIGMSRLSDGGGWNVAALHEFGTKSMPRRGLLTADPVAGTLGDQDRQDINEVVQDWLHQLL